MWTLTANAPLQPTPPPPPPPPPPLKKKHCVAIRCTKQVLLFSNSRIFPNHFLALNSLCRWGPERAETHGGAQQHGRVRSAARHREAAQQRGQEEKHHAPEVCGWVFFPQLLEALERLCSSFPLFSLLSLSSFYLTQSSAKMYKCNWRTLPYLRNLDWLHVIRFVTLAAARRDSSMIFTLSAADLLSGRVTE